MSEPKKGFFSKILDAVTEETGGGATTAALPTPQSAPAGPVFYTPPATTSPPAITWGPTPTPVAVGVDPEMRRTIETKLGEASADPYKRFVEILNQLRAHVPDEPTRIRSALASATVFGYTPEVVLTALDHRLKLLEDLRTEFTQSAQQQRETKVGAAKAAADGLATELKRLETEATALALRIEDLRRQWQQREQDVQNQTIKIQATEERMYATLAAVQAEAARERNTVAQYITPKGV